MNRPSRKGAYTPIPRREFLAKSTTVCLSSLLLDGVVPSAWGRPQIHSSEVLHNGIRIADDWPPGSLLVESDLPMPVPYLQCPPDCIPIDTGRQLLVDDFLVQRTDLERVFHHPTNVPSNPVLFPETADEMESNGLEGDERAVCYLGHGGVFWDRRERHYKMFYTAGWRGGLALAISSDLMKWQRPDLGFHGKGSNLILPHGNAAAGGDNCLWLDEFADNPAHRFKMMTTRDRVRPRGPFIHTLHTSADGLHWSEGVRTGDASDYCSFFYNPFRKVWAFSIKQNGPRGRCRFYSENVDFLAGADWSRSVYWTNADRLDSPDPSVGDSPQLYSLNAVAYESLHVGMFYIHRGPHNRICEEGSFPKLTDLSIGFSRDGFHWSRPDRQPFIAASRQEGTWNRAYLHGTTGVFLVHDDALIFPYTGYSGVAPCGHRGMYTGASIGMAKLRRDGFASMRARLRSGELTTRILRFNGSALWVNVDCPLGSLQAEVLDESGRSIEPFTLANCVKVHTNGTRCRIRWMGDPDLRTLAGKPVSIRFHLTNGDLYAFWVTSDSAGSSNGHLAAGGPESV